MGKALLSWFSAADDPASVDAATIRRVIRELPGDAHKAMGELNFWLDSVNSGEGLTLERRFGMLDEISQAAQPHLRRLAKQYLQRRQHKFQENRIWMAQAEYWRLTGAGHIRCIDGFQSNEAGASGLKAQLQTVVRRAIYAIGQQLKWSLMRYSPLGTVCWTDLGRLYAFAEARGLDSSAAPRAKGEGAGGSVRDELMKTLMLASASAESLMPEQIEIAARTIALFAPGFLLGTGDPSGFTHAFDLAAGKSPKRLRSRTEGIEPSTRFFSAGSACEEMSKHLVSSLAEGVMPPGLDTAGEPTPQMTAEVWRHLLQQWSAKPPERSSVRQSTNTCLYVVQGLKGLSNALEDQPEDSLDFTQTAQLQVDTWAADDASAGGYGALAPMRGSEWVHVGALIGLQEEGDARWNAAIVRRLAREDERYWRLGIQVLARAVFPVRLSPIVTTTKPCAIQANDFALLLTPRPDAERCVKLAIPANTFTSGAALQMRVRDQVFEILPIKLLNTFEEFDIARFSVARRIEDQ